MKLHPLTHLPCWVLGIMLLIQIFAWRPQVGGSKPKVAAI